MKNAPQDVEAILTNTSSPEIAERRRAMAWSCLLYTSIMQKLAALQTATKRALYEAILYPGVDNFVKYFLLQNYWTQQAGLFTMSATKAMLAHPELDYNLQYSHYNGTVLNLSLIHI